MHCHHNIPKEFGGLDVYKNLVFVTGEVHRLIHAVNNDVIQNYMKVLKLDDKQLKKLNQLRILAKREVITT